LNHLSTTLDLSQTITIKATLKQEDISFDLGRICFKQAEAKSGVRAHFTKGGEVLKKLAARACCRMMRKQNESGLMKRDWMNLLRYIYEEM